MPSWMTPPGELETWLQDPAALDSHLALGGLAEIWRADFGDNTEYLNAQTASERKYKTNSADLWWRKA